MASGRRDPDMCREQSAKVSVKNNDKYLLNMMFVLLKSVRLSLKKTSFGYEYLLF